MTVHAIRGNHDSLFEWSDEIELSLQYDQWSMPSLYYTKTFEIEDNKKIGFLFVDSVLMLCSNLTLSDGEFVEMTSA